MRSFKLKNLSRNAFFETKPTRYNFTGKLALELWTQTPGGKDPVDSILLQVRALARTLGLTSPPFRPALYAPLRKVKEIRYKPMHIDGRLLPMGDGFIIELRRGFPGRENFTLAHEIAHTFFFELAPSVKYQNLKFAFSR